MAEQKRSTSGLSTVAWQASSLSGAAAAALTADASLRTCSRHHAQTAELVASIAAAERTVASRTERAKAALAQADAAAMETHALEAHSRKVFTLAQQARELSSKLEMEKGASRQACANQLREMARLQAESATLQREQAIQFDHLDAARKDVEAVTRERTRLELSVKAATEQLETGQRGLEVVVRGRQEAEAGLERVKQSAEEARLQLVHAEEVVMAWRGKLREEDIAAQLETSVATVAQDSARLRAELAGTGRTLQATEKDLLAARASRSAVFQGLTQHHEARIGHAEDEAALGRLRMDATAAEHQLANATAEAVELRAQQEGMAARLASVRQESITHVGELDQQRLATVERVHELELGLASQPAAAQAVTRCRPELSGLQRTLERDAKAGFELDRQLEQARGEVHESRRELTMLEEEQGTKEKQRSEDLSYQDLQAQQQQDALVQLSREREEARGSLRRELEAAQE